MSPALHLVHPGPADAPTGGSRYNLRLSQALQAAGRDIVLHRLDGRWPRPGADEETTYAAELAAIGDGALVLVDGLVFSAAPEVAAAHARRLRLVPVLHLPLAAETGLDPAEARRLEGLERAALAQAFRVLATSDFSARTLVGLGVPRERTWMVEPGVDPAPVAAGGDGSRLLCLASLTPRKGQDVLVEALGALANRAWQCDLVGPCDHAPGFVDDLRRRIQALGLDARVHIHGPRAGRALEAVWQGADVLVLPSHFETYGMVLTEALGRGIPVVSTTAGAIPETVPADAALLVPPGDATALREALARWLDDDALRAGLRHAALQARGQLRDWPRQAQRFEALLAGVGA